jgi:hypothetical protein
MAQQLLVDDEWKVFFIEMHHSEMDTHVHGILSIYVISTHTGNSKKVKKANFDLRLEKIKKK